MLWLICIVAFLSAPITAFRFQRNSPRTILSSRYASIWLPEQNHKHHYSGSASLIPSPLPTPSTPPLPLPLQNNPNLPALTPTDYLRLSRGERVQKQSREGRAGHGIVVLDVPAYVDEVFATLQQFERYSELIPTIRAAKVDRSERGAKAEYALSKFMLRVCVEHSVHSEQNMITFKLDANRPNMVLRRADGMWLATPSPDNPAHTRVFLTASIVAIFLTASIVASKVVPSVIVDYAAYRALPRATNWLKPYFAGLPNDEGPFLC
eukprot:gene24973-30170_t